MRHQPPCQTDLKAFNTSAPNVCFAFTGMLSFWEVFASLKKGVGVEQAFPRMKKTAILSGILVLILYLLVSGFCILAFGTDAGKQRKGNGYGNVLYNFPVDNYPVTLLCLGFGVPYFNTFFWDLFLKGNHSEKKVYTFSPKP